MAGRKGSIEFWLLARVKDRFNNVNLITKKLHKYWLQLFFKNLVDVMIKTKTVEQNKICRISCKHKSAKYA